jgi:aspartate racemase
MAKTIGILGGMGPAATALVFDLIIKLTPAQKDQDHLPVIINNLPQIPDRTAAILGEGPSPVPAVVAGLNLLQRTGVDFVIIPCNTVFYFYDDFFPKVNLPVIHICTPVIQHLKSTTTSANRKIGILSTTGTNRTKIYENFFQRHGYQPILPSEKNQNNLMHAIYEIKAGKCQVEPILEAGSELLNYGASKVILGCTELSLVFDALGENLPVVDSTRCLAQAAVDIALGKKKVQDFVV